jgi:cytochrome c-type biogenesis protein CcmE/histidinol-phosphate/aromatic aminotransferase/cobyric acid decarboxylase-like protein
VLDVSWLLRAQRRQSPGSEQPGAGLLPENWLDHEMVAAAVRGVGRSRGSWLLKYGPIEGYLPLREALATRLACVGIDVVPDQIITTAGATEAMDIVARRFLAPGDLVFVEDPAWFVMFARFAAFGARIVGVPRGPEGPDLAALTSLLAREKPKLFIMSSVLHNPTGSSMSAANAARLLQLANQHDFVILEDDIYGDLHGRHGLRLASLDDGRRVVYVGGFSKSLAANLRVGFVAAHPALVRELRDIKALTGLASSELCERVAPCDQFGPWYDQRAKRTELRRARDSGGEGHCTAGDMLSPRMARTLYCNPMNARTKFILGGALVLGSAGYLMASSIKETAVYYLTPGELSAKTLADTTFFDTGVKVGARVVPGSIKRAPGGRETSFAMTDGAKTYDVVYRGITPDTFTDGVDVVVEGRLGRDGTFRATTLLAKCASRYENAPEKYKQTPAYRSAAEGA